jgi:hypothetical protein
VDLGSIDLMKHCTRSTHGISLAAIVAGVLLWVQPLWAQREPQAPLEAASQAAQTVPPSSLAGAPAESPSAIAVTAEAQTNPPSDPPAAVQPGPPPKVPKDDRIFFALPNYLTVENAEHLPPLTVKQKFKTVAEGCFDPVEVVFIGIQAGIDQMDNVNPTYHQGFVGYSKRFGTAYTDAIIGNFGTGAIFPTLLKQDPRYYQMGKGNFFWRFGYAAMRVVVTRSDTSGRREFNFSEFLGNGMAAGLSNLYHPRPHTIIGSTDVLGTQVLLDALGYELKEFWPDIHRGLSHAHHKM